MVKREAQLFWAGLAISGILIAALWGFLLVDISTEKYMPADAGALLRLEGIDSEGMRISVFGRQYRVDSGQLDGLREKIWEYRGFLPGEAVLSGMLTAKAFFAGWDYVEERNEAEKAAERLLQ